MIFLNGFRYCVHRKKLVQRDKSQPHLEILKYICNQYGISKMADKNMN